MGQSEISTADMIAFTSLVPPECLEAVQLVISRIRYANTYAAIHRQPPLWSAEYEHLDFLGRGGMGSVFLVAPHHSSHDPRTWRALKIPHITSGYDFIGEIWNHILVPPHPCLVTWNYLRQFDTSPCIFMEYMAGGSLADVISEASWKTEEDWLSNFFDVAIQCSWAIKHLHGHQLIHQDIKPANILFRLDRKQGCRVGLADFGISTFAAADAPSATVIGLTEEFAAPEQVTLREAFNASDVFSLGRVLTELYNVRPSNSVEQNDLYLLIEEMTTVDHGERPTVESVIERSLNLHKSICGKVYPITEPATPDLDALNERVLFELSDPSSVLFRAVQYTPGQLDRTGRVRMALRQEKQPRELQLFYQELSEGRSPQQTARISLLIQVVFKRALDDQLVIRLDELSTIAESIERVVDRYESMPWPGTYALEFRDAAVPMLRAFRLRADGHDKQEVDRILNAIGRDET